MGRSLSSQNGNDDEDLSSGEFSGDLEDFDSIEIASEDDDFDSANNKEDNYPNDEDEDPIEIASDDDDFSPGNANEGNDYTSNHNPSEDKGHTSEVDQEDTLDDASDGDGDPNQSPPQDKDSGDTDEDKVKDQKPNEPENDYLSKFNRLFAYRSSTCEIMACACNLGEPKFGTIQGFTDSIPCNNGPYPIDYCHRCTSKTFQEKIHRQTSTCSLMVETCPKETLTGINDTLLKKK